MNHWLVRATFAAALVGAGLGCSSGHGSIAEDISAPLGEPVPYATAEQLAAFERGKDVALHRFTRAEGLGPAFNVTFCASCHERPVTGGSAGTYRNFSIAARLTPDGAYQPAMSAGPAGGVVRLYQYADGEPARPLLDPADNIVGGRNPIPFFGVGLLAELDEDEILKRSDPDDENNDGISGRPNYDRGFVGRFGRKAQTVSVEGFIRGPLFNHLGVTTDPLTEAEKAALPVNSSGSAQAFHWSFSLIKEAYAQVAAPETPLTDDDGVPDPEMTNAELFDLVSMSMLMAAPQVSTELTDEEKAGRGRFDDAGCGDCHTPRLKSPRGNLPVYSDLLLHDMGPDMDDGVRAGEATGTEYRTQPLWGIHAVGPYLHDGRAGSMEEAILWHGGEGQASRDAFAALDLTARGELIAFLSSLGGRDQYTEGLIPPGEPNPAPGDWGGPDTALSPDEAALFEEARLLFDREFSFGDGAGGPRFNGDSCRACHFEPVFGGAGPRGVNVSRHGILTEQGDFAVPAVGTILHRATSLSDSAVRAQPEAEIFEHRQTPHLFGLGLLEGVSEDEILSRADPDDIDGDGISGKASWTDGGRLGRFGWKAQVPNIDEFVRDAVTAELGMTLPWVEGLTFGRVQDNDSIPDPEFSLADADLLAFYLRRLAPPPRTPGPDPAAEAAGEQVFADVGCDGCHTPSLAGASGPVAAYTDLLLHDVLPEGRLGIEDASAEMGEFRTSPLWGVAQTAPYMHSGEADSVREAILLHAGEALGAVTAFSALDQADQAALLAFVESL
ncbi:MAG: hypothetical protein KDA24_17280 [Deltaproteobacteria bacterium]|nr:hypothetical protein [Deltaproteobacteria bacterium]